MFTTLGAWLTTFLTGYVATVVSTVAAALAPLALILLTIYIANYGYAVARGEVDEPIAVFGWKMVKLGFITSIALGSGLYMELVGASIENLQDGVATLFISGGSGGSYAGASTAWEALDAANTRASDLIATLWGEATWSRLDLLLACVVFSFGFCGFLVTGAAVVLVAKMFMAFALAVGPAAVLCLMFRPSAKFFDSWLSVAIAAAVLSWFVYFALGLSLFIAAETARAVADSGAFGGGASTVSPIAASFQAAVMYVLLAILLWQAPRLASAMTGGPAMSSGAATAVSYVIGRGSVTGSVAGAGRGHNAVIAGGGLAYASGRAAGMAWQRVPQLFGGRR